MSDRVKRGDAPIEAPATEAGRAFVDDGDTGSESTTFGSIRQAVLAIEAEKDAEYERVVDRYRQQRDEAYAARDEGRQEAVRPDADELEQRIGHLLHQGYEIRFWPKNGDGSFGVVSAQEFSELLARHGRSSDPHGG